MLQDDRSIKLNFKFMLLAAALVTLCYLCQVHLVEAMGVAQTVLMAIGLPLSVGGVAGSDLLHRTFPVPFQVDADATVERQMWEVYVKVGYSALDNFCQHLTCCLVVGHTCL